MATVTSLGLHQPTGLHYAVQERLLPADPPSTAYTWQNHSEYDSANGLNDDELLVTARCVIWSRGGIFRKSYNFDLENEEVSQALLTTFPSVGPLAGRETKSELGANAAISDSKSPAIVVFLKTQAHIYFLAGTSHVIHLPFEVDSATAAPHGLIIQRKLRVDNLVAASLKFPTVPPNSFVSSHPQPWSAASSIQSTFSIADLGAPKPMPSLPNSTMKDLWDPPSLKNDSNWPRLFSLSDPLAEMGLVVAQPEKSGYRGKRGSTKISALDTAEELVHISRKGEFSSAGNQQSLVLALTLNRETSMYTVWKLSYVGKESLAREKQRVPSGTMSRRRSSFVPGTATGATTPVLGPQIPRESFGGNPTLTGAKKIARIDDNTREKVVDFAASLDAEFENPAIPRRKSRRVSSMLARADLSASHERSAFSELASGLPHGTSRRGESMGGQQARTSMAGLGASLGQSFSQSQFNNSINSYLEAPVDDLLDELRAGGDFEGFHNMGLDDEEFDALKQEVVLTKVCRVPAEHSNVRYSSQQFPAKSQCKIFTLTAPPSLDRRGNTIIVCILDLDEKKLIVLTLLAETHKKSYPDATNIHADIPNTDNEIVVVSLSNTMRANSVIDICKLEDGFHSRMLVLSETNDGFGELSLQAPWSVLMKINLPRHFAISNIKNLSHDSIPLARREGGFKRILSKGPRALRQLRNAKPGGLVDVVDDAGRMHQLRIQMQPRDPLVRTAIEVCRILVPGATGGEGILTAWWNVMQWLRLESIEVINVEWSAFVITVFALILSTNKTSKTTQTKTHVRRKSRGGFLRSSSGSYADHEDWDLMQAQEMSNGNRLPAWAQNRGWQWLDGDDSTDARTSRKSDAAFSIFAANASEKGSFISEHVQLTRNFIATELGHSVISGSFTTLDDAKGSDTRRAAITTIVVGLHVLHEEQKLDTTKSDSLSTGVASLTPVLSQLAKWLGWESWIDHYDTEDAALLDEEFDIDAKISYAIPEPFPCPAIYDWIEQSLLNSRPSPFMTLPQLARTQYAMSLQQDTRWRDLTPRTLLFSDVFASKQDDWSSSHFVEALVSAGMDSLLLETLPEAVLAPFREAIAHCQSEPPTTWSKRLLAIVGREDVNMLLTPGQRPRNTQTTLLVGAASIIVSSKANIYRHPLTRQVLMYIAYAYQPATLKQQVHLMDLLKLIDRL